MKFLSSLLESNVVSCSVAGGWNMLPLPEFGVPFAYFLRSRDLFPHA